MAKGKHRNITNRNQGNMAASEPNSPLAACSGYPNTPEKQDLDLKSMVMMLLQEYMKNINKSPKEIQENSEANKEEMQKKNHLKKYRRILVNSLKS